MNKLVTVLDYDPSSEYYKCIVKSVFPNVSDSLLRDRQYEHKISIIAIEPTIRPFDPIDKHRNIIDVKRVDSQEKMDKFLAEIGRE